MVLRLLVRGQNYKKVIIRSIDSAPSDNFNLEDKITKRNINMGSKMLDNSKNLFLLSGISTSCYPTKVVGMFA